MKFDQGSIFQIMVFVVPGFVLNSVLSMLVPLKDESWDLSLLRFVTFSSINYALWAWLIFLVVGNEFFLGHPMRAAMAWVLIVLLSPIILGIIAGKTRQTGIVRNALSRLGINTLHPDPSAWDYFLSKTSPVWALIKLIDGTSVAGYFGPESSASSDPKERDIYLERVYNVQDGVWQPLERTAGILIRGDQIRWVGFFSKESGGNTDG